MENVRYFLAIIIAGLLAFSASFAVQAQEGVGDYLVTYESSAVRPQSLPNGYRARSLGARVDLVSGADAQTLRSMPGVAVVERDRLMYPSSTPVTNDPNFGWHLPAINMPSYGGGAGVNVAVLDSGYNVDHPDITYNYTHNVVSGSSDVWVNNRHGMGTSGVIGAIANNGTGVAGVADGVGLMGIQVTEYDHGAALLSDIVLGLNHAADNGARIISASFSNLAISPTFFRAAETFREVHDGQTVIAAGNSGQDTSSHNSFALTVVGATDQNNERASFSTYGTQLDLVAPGVNIWTLNKDGSRRSSGTSFAGPLVAGVMSLIIATNPDMPMEEVQQRLLDTAFDLGPIGYDVETGEGLLNVRGALGDGSAVPVPAAVWLFGSGLLGLVGVARRKAG